MGDHTLVLTIPQLQPTSLLSAVQTMPFRWHGGLESQRPSLKTLLSSLVYFLLAQTTVPIKPALYWAWAVWPQRLAHIQSTMYGLPPM